MFDPALPRSVLTRLTRSVLVKQISNSDREEYIPATFARTLLHIPCIAEREMGRRGQLKAIARDRTVARAAERSITRADPRDVEHEHRADRIDVYIVEERVESATREGHLVSRLFLRAVLVNLLKLSRHRFSQCLKSIRRRANSGITERAIQIVSHAVFTFNS